MTTEWHKKAQQQLKPPQLVWVCSKLMTLLQSAITFPIITWLGNLSTGDKNRLRHKVNVASKIGVKLPDLSHIFKGLSNFTVSFRSLIEW